jgi:RNA polymerase sigma-54 factor
MAEMGFTQEMKMQQTLAPQLYQSLEILQMPLLDLQQMVKQELSENPTLELQQPEADAQIEVETGTQDAEQFDKEMGALAEEWGGPVSSEGIGDAEEKHRLMMDNLTEQVSMQDQLLEQLRMISLSERERTIAELIIGHIDDEGYLQLDVDEWMERPDFPVDLFEGIITTIQQFDPPGIGARSLPECLALQLERSGESDTIAYQILENHFDLLGKNRLDEIAVQMNLTVEEVAFASARIAKLDPKPGYQLQPDNTEYVTPEVYIDKVDGVYRVRANRKPYPRLFLNQNYIRMLKDKQTPAETKKYIREKLAKSRLMIQSIDQRLSMIEQVATELVGIQYDFLERGPIGLKPLNMRQMAETLGVHETTVSRTASGKYVQTPQGLFDLKYFFKPGVRSVSGETVSNEHAKSVLAELIARENKKKPHSDAALVELLKEKNVDISRRTVAKYRDQLKILSSHLRRER